MSKILKVQIIIFGFLICIAFGSFSPIILSTITAFGHGIPSTDILSDYFTGVFWAFLLGIFIIFSGLELHDKTALLVLWICKCLVTLGAMLVYENAYGLDAYYYFQVASQPFYAWKSITFGQGTEIVCGLAWILVHVFKVGISYHALKVVFSMIGLLGIYFFYLGVSELVGKRVRFNLYLLGLFPSVLFWSSILGKDPLNLFGVGLYFYGICKWYREEKWLYLFLALAGMIVASAMRSWYFVILFLPLLILFWKSWNHVPSFGKGSLFSAFLVVFGVLLASLPMISERFKANDLDQAISATNTISHSWGYGGSAVSEIPKFTSLGSMLVFAPYGMFTALFRPLPGEVMNGFGLIAGLENLALIYLLFRFALKSQWNLWIRTRMGTWLITLVLTWSAIYCFISPQNLGSAVRFKLQILPILIAMIIIGKWNQERISCAE